MSSTGDNALYRPLFGVRKGPGWLKTCMPHRAPDAAGLRGLQGICAVIPTSMGWDANRASMAIDFHSQHNRQPDVADRLTHRFDLEMGCGVGSAA